MHERLQGLSHVLAARLAIAVVCFVALVRRARKLTRRSRLKAISSLAAISYCRLVVVIIAAMFQQGYQKPEKCG